MIVAGINKMNGFDGIIGYQLLQSVGPFFVTITFRTLQMRAIHPRVIPFMGKTFPVVHTREIHNHHSSVVCCIHITQNLFILTNSTNIIPSAQMTE